MRCNYCNKNYNEKKPFCSENCEEGYIALTKIMKQNIEKFKKEKSSLVIVLKDLEGSE